MKTQITRQNYEAFLLDRIEGKLNSEELTLLEEFLQQNPDLEVSDSDYDETLRVSYDHTLYFEDKNSLKAIANSKHAKIISLNIRLIYLSAAAMLLLVLGIGLFMKNNGDNTMINTELTAKNNDLKPLRTEKNETKDRLVATKPNVKSLKPQKTTVKRQDISLKEENMEMNSEQTQTDTQEIMQDIEIHQTNLLVYDTDSQEEIVEIESNNLLAYDDSDNSDWKTRFSKDMSSKIRKTLTLR